MSRDLSPHGNVSDRKCTLYEVKLTDEIGGKNSDEESQIRTSEMRFD